MYKFIRYFVNQWRAYPQFRQFCTEYIGMDKFEELAGKDRDPEKSRRMLNSRFCYAYENAKIYYAHRDRYGRKCRKFAGNCEICNAKHC